jgi:hypothetical protein
VLGQKVGQRFMARQINRLTTRLVAALVERAGRGQLRPEDYRRHADGGNLYLVVKENGGIGWNFIYRWHGKPVEIGLGSARDVSLGSARTRQARSVPTASADAQRVRTSHEEKLLIDANDLSPPSFACASSRIRSCASVAST